MIIAGIDPGTVRIGFAFLEKQTGEPELLDYGCIDLVGTKDQIVRLSLIRQGVSRLIAKYRPEVLATEKLFFSVNRKTAIPVAEARGVIINTASELGLEILEFNPMEIKMALTGYGRADKLQIQRMVAGILKLKTAPKPDDAADAIALALTACYTNKNLKSKV